MNRYIIGAIVYLQEDQNADDISEAVKKLEGIKNVRNRTGMTIIYAEYFGEKNSTTIKEVITKAIEDTSAIVTSIDTDIDD